MAIGPINEMNEDDMILARDLEAYIDAKIKEDYDGEASFTVSLQSFPRLRVRSYLVQRYSDAGWGGMKWQDDQRDGPCITLYIPTHYTTGRD